MMVFKTEIKIRILLLYLWVRSAVERIKVYLGLHDCKYGLMGGFMYKDILLTPFLHQVERVEECQRYSKFRPDDVVLLTYPKSGTHLTGEIIASIYKEVGKLKTAGLSAIVSLEAQPPSIFHSRASGNDQGVMWDVEAAASPRIIKSHLSWNFMPKDVKEGRVKVITTFRNPKDVVCSFYPFLQKMGRLYDITFNQFFSRFLEGNVLYGGYFKYIKEWYPYRNNPNALNIYYEDLCEDPVGHVRKIASFLEIKLADDQVEKVVKATSFASMQKSIGRKHPIFRKGKTGSWRNELTVSQNEQMEDWIEEGMKGLNDFKLKCS